MTTVSEICVNAVRGALVAGEKKKFVVSDLSNIEGRTAAWLGGEEWKLRAFRDYDTVVGTDAKGKPIRKGLDLYVLAYSRAFNVHPDIVDYVLRQIGKVMELSMQFGGSVGAFVTMGANYGVVLADVAEIVRQNASVEDWNRARDSYEERFNSGGLPLDVWTGIKCLVNAWRSAHPRIVSLWYAIDDAARSAIRFPREAFQANDLRFDLADGWLRIRLPSGRYLSYPNARIGARCARCEGTGKTFVAADTEVVCPECEGTGKSDTQLRYDGVDQFTKKWGTIRTYGGKLFENIVQATARDIFLHGFRAAEHNGYPVVLRVHDELVCETPDNDNYTAEGLSAIMATNPSWALGLPLAAAGHQMQRYSKQD